MTPDQVHYGQVDAVHAARQATLDRAFAESPARFVNKPPSPPAKPTQAWINPPPPGRQHGRQQRGIEDAAPLHSVT